ncbi:MAG: hypothetical protein WDO12_13340 [Pseudomonadota bacterium]
MSAFITRRTLLAGAGYAAAGTALASQLVSVAAAQEAAQPQPASLC